MAIGIRLACQVRCRDLMEATRRAQPPSVPLVDGTSPAARGSIATAARSARASPLKQDSAMWWSLVPYSVCDVQRDAGVHGERLEPFLHQFGVERADLVAHELGLEHQERPARDVDRHARQRLVHRHVHVGVAGDALHVAERLLHRLAERDADILGGVVVVDMQVALGLARSDRCANGAPAGRACGRKSRCRSRSTTRRVPSRSTATSTSVSLVARLMVALRMQKSSRTRPGDAGNRRKRRALRVSPAFYQGPSDFATAAYQQG